MYLLSEIERYEDAEAIAETIKESINEPMRYKDLELQIDTSIGIAVYPTDSLVEKNLLNVADRNMYRSKNP